MLPKISVVIPLYNKEHYIQKTVESVLAQTFSDFELIIVDDGSTDNSVSIVKNISDERIRLLSEKNSGQAVARNYGIRSSSADLIAFLDADDEWLPNFLETIYAMYQQYPEAGMYGTAYSVYVNGEHARDNTWMPELGTRVLQSYFNDTAVYGKTVFPTSASAARREALDKIHGYQEDYRSGQDHDLFGRMALYYPICYSPEVCAIYYAGAENNCDRLSYAREIPTERYLNSLPESEKDAFLQRADIKLFLNYYYLKIGGINVYGGMRKEGRGQLKKVSLKEMRMKKLMFMCLSYIPFSVSSLPPNLVRAVANKMKLAT